MFQQLRVTFLRTSSETTIEFRTIAASYTVADPGFGNGGGHFRKKLIFIKNISTKTLLFSKYYRDSSSPPFLPSRINSKTINHSRLAACLTFWILTHCLSILF